MFYFIGLLLFCKSLFSLDHIDENRYINDFFEIDTIYILPFEEANDFLCFNFFDDKLYIVGTPYSMNSKKTFNLLEYNCKSKKLNDLELFLPDSLKSIFVINIEINENNLFLLGWNRLLIFDRKNRKFSKLINLNRPYRYLKCINNTLYLTESGIYGSNRMADSYTHLGIINLQTFNYSFIDLKDPSSIQFCYFQPRKIIAMSDKNILLSDVDKYKFEIYEYDTINKISFSYDHPNWKTIENLYYKQITPPRDKVYYPKSYIDSLRPYYNKISTIKKVDFINDSTFLINWDIPSNEVDRENFFDLWRIENPMTKAHPVFVGMKQRIPKENEIFIIQKILPIYESYVINDNYLIDIQPMPISIYKNTTYINLFNEINNYLKNNDMKYSIVIRRFKGF
jgi:hypothetical protein